MCASVVGIGDGDCNHFSHLHDDVILGFVVSPQLVLHVALILVVGVADVDDFGDYYDDRVLPIVSLWLPIVSLGNIVHTTFVFLFR